MEDWLPLLPRSPCWPATPGRIPCKSWRARRSPDPHADLPRRGPGRRQFRCCCITMARQRARSARTRLRAGRFRAMLAASRQPDYRAATQYIVLLEKRVGPEDQFDAHNIAHILARRANDDTMYPIVPAGGRHRAYVSRLLPLTCLASNIAEGSSTAATEGAEAHRDATGHSAELRRGTRARNSDRLLGRLIHQPGLLLLPEPRLRLRGSR